MTSALLLCGCSHWSVSECLSAGDAILKAADSASSIVGRSGSVTQALGSAGRMMAEAPLGLAGLQGIDNQLCWLDSFMEEDALGGSGSMGLANLDGDDGSQALTHSRDPQATNNTQFVIRKRLLVFFRHQPQGDGRPILVSISRCTRRRLHCCGSQAPRPDSSSCQCCTQDGRRRNGCFKKRASEDRADRACL